MIHGACALPSSTTRAIGAVDCNDVVPSATSGDTLLLMLTVTSFSSSRPSSPSAACDGSLETALCDRDVVFLGAIGLRLAEVLGLRVGSIDFLRRTLTVRSTINEVEGQIVEGRGKTVASERTISLPQSVLDELAAHLARTGRREPEALVFQAPEGGPVRATNFRLRVYRPATEKAALDGLSFHRLRHSAGHIMRELGVPLEVIQKRLGHRSIRTTADVYGSLPESIDRDVADRLDVLLGPSSGGTENEARSG